MFRMKKFFLAPVVVLILVSGFTFVQKDIYFDIAKSIDIFTKVYKEISFNYVDEINPEQFIRAGIKGMLNSLDPYTIFIDEKKFDDFEILTNGKYGGVGVSIGLKDNKVTVLEIMEGYSAHKQGVRIGDVVIEVNNNAVGIDNYDEVGRLVKGEPGTFVELKIIRDNIKDTLKFNLLREEIVIKNIAFADFVPDNSNDVYIKLTGFSRVAGDELKKAILDLKRKREIKSIILDLRNNPGGLLDIAVDICNKFLKKGELIVSTKGRDTTSIKNYFATQETLLQDIPMVVIVNDGSASASEIVAGAIQDHDRGVIIGTKTFGKGLVQTISPLSYNTSLKITTAKYFTPSGRCIQKIDYSKKNSVISRYDTLLVSPFNTDNKRQVYSSGGITPDTLIESEELKDISKDLLAKGLIFNFANHYYNQNSKENFQNIKNEKVFSDFKKYLIEYKYQFKSEIAKKLDEAIASVKDDKKNYKNIKARLSELSDEINNLTQNDIDIFKDEVQRILRQELADRFLGNEGRINEMLSSDLNYRFAIRLLKNENLYKKILNKN